MSSDSHSLDGRSCVFCQISRADSREHVFADWMNREFRVPPAENSRVDIRGTFRFGPNHAVEKIAQERPRQGTSKTIRPKVVCANCNNGWMSIIERQTKDLIIDLSKRERMRLRSAQLKDLSTWLCMKAMVIDASARNFVSPADRTWLFRHKEPPPNGWQIFIGGSQALEGKTEFNQFSAEVISKDLENRGYIQSTLMIIGGVLGFSMTGTHAEKLPLRNALLRRIWPLDGTSVLWPRPRSLDEWEADRLATVFTRIPQAEYR